MVFTCLMLIFFMNQLDSTYMKFTLGLLIFSELLDIAWLFLYSNQYWNLPSVGTVSQAMGGYMKVIIILTYVGVFVKIPLGIFLFHYRNVDESKQYVMNLSCLKMSLTPDKINPISDGLKNLELAKL
jgi:ABC-type phosphate transport system permease subunit